MRRPLVDRQCNRLASYPTLYALGLRTSHCEGPAEELIISFERRDLQQLCCKLEVAEQQLGVVHAQELASAIADVEAFKHAEELIGFFGDEVLIGGDDSLTMPIGSAYRAMFFAAGAKFTRDAEGRVVWSTVTRMKLMDISICR